MLIYLSFMVVNFFIVLMYTFYYNRHCGSNYGENISEDIDFFITFIILSYVSFFCALMAIAFIAFAALIFCLISVAEYFNIEKLLKPIEHFLDNFGKKEEENEK